MEGKGKEECNDSWLEPVLSAHTYGLITLTLTDVPARRKQIIVIFLMIRRIYKSERH